MLIWLRTMIGKSGMVWYGGLETVIRLELEVLYCHLKGSFLRYHYRRPRARQPAGRTEVAEGLVKPDRSHEESQNANFEQNHSLATVNSLMHTPVLQMDVKSVEKESVYFSLPF